MRTLACALLVLLTPLCFASSKQYQQAKFIGSSTHAYSKIVPLNSYGMTISKRRHEDDLSFQLGDIIYTGRCEERNRKCRPANWIVGDMVPVRLEKGHMYLELPNGKELKTEVVKRARAQAN